MAATDGPVLSVLQPDARQPGGADDATVASSVDASQPMAQTTGASSSRQTLRSATRGLIVAPFVGAAFVIFLPVIGFVLLGEALWLKCRR